MLFIGRGFVLGLTGGKTIAYPDQGDGLSAVLPARRDQRLRLQQPDRRSSLVVAVVGAVVLAKTRWGYETFATGGNEQAAIYAGIPTRWVRIRAYLLSSLCATLAGLMAVAQDKGVTAAVRPQRRTDRHRLGDHRRRLDPRRPRPGHRRLPRRAPRRADRQGAARGLADHPHHRDRRRGDHGQRRVLSCRPARCRPSSACSCVVAVLIEPYIIRRQVPARLWAWLRGKPPPPAVEIGGVASRASQTKGAMATDKALTARGLRQVPRPARRARHHPDGRCCGWSASMLRPDYWWNLPNTFAILLNYTELALITDRPHLRHRRRRHRPLGRRGAGARRQRRRLFPEGAGRRPGDRHGDGPARRHVRRRWSTRCSPSASGCRPSSPRSACSTSPAASPPGSSPASSSPAFPRATT